MEWGLYLSFLAFVLVIAFTPGADTAVVLKNVVTGGRRGGLASAAGVFSASALQAVLVAVGLGVLIAQSQTLLQVNPVGRCRLSSVARFPISACGNPG